jgi:hypothetical protein
LAILLLVAVGGVGCTAEPAPSAAPTIRDLVLRDDRGQAPMEVRVIDDAGHLVDAHPATADQLTEESHLMSGQIAAKALPPDDNKVLVLWVGFACDKAGAMTISVDGNSITVAPEPITTCDLVPSYRGVELTFNQARSAYSLRVNLRPTEVTGD